MLFRLRDLVEQHARRVVLNQQEGILLFVSLSDSQKRAQAYHFFGLDFDQTWEQVVSHYGLWLKSHGSAPSWIRVDWARTVRQASLAQVKHWFKDVKRNYMRWGMVIGAQCQYAFTEQELNANAMLYQGTQVPHAQINEQNFRVYGKRKYVDFEYDFAPEQLVHLVDTAGVFISAEEGPYLLYRRGRNAGRRVIRKLDESRVTHLITTASQYLTQQVQPYGRFYYGWHPCFDREIRFYNTLRHASTIYSMVEAWEVTRCDALRVAIDRALQYVIETFVKYDQNAAGEQIAFLVEHDLKEIKLGANAVLILALTKYSEVFETEQYLPLLEALALGIQLMQDPQSGQLTHVLNYPDLSTKEKFRVIYYDGEAAFGLMRLYGLTRDARWLAIVEKAFDYFIAAEHWKVHDHWLSYCVNELTRYREEEKYYRFGIQNVAGYLDFVTNRITTFPTLLELMMAAEQMVERLRHSEQFRHLLEELDQEAFYQALEKRAHYLLNGYFAPEIAMYFANPQRILGSFFIRHHSFRVRIDDVEHYLSGYVAYLKYLKKKRVTLKTKQKIIKKTAGRWIKEPDRNWQFTGLCVSPAYFRSGDMVCVYGEKGQAGIRQAALESLVRRGASALLVESTEGVEEFGLPVLLVNNVRKATLDLGVMARDMFPGCVVGITGSAGKTTMTAYLTHILDRVGGSSGSLGSANVPFGIGWNLSCMDQEAQTWCVEMAIGSMALNTEMVRPHIAVVTNVAPAHLIYHETVEKIAYKKARIFDAMPLKGAKTILFRDMPYFEVFLKKARERNIEVLTFGEHIECDFRLLSLDENSIRISLKGIEKDFCYPLQDKRDAYNLLAALAVLEALQIPYEKVKKELFSFIPIEGRNRIKSLVVNKNKVLLIDDSYNANPLSMKIALESLQKYHGKKKLLILGDMLELGEESSSYHIELAPHVLACEPNTVILCGNEMKHLWNELKSKKQSFQEKTKGIERIKWYESAAEIKENLESLLEGYEVVLIKASNSVGLYKLFN